MHETEKHYGLNIRYTDKLTDRVELLHNESEQYIMKRKPNAAKADKEAQLLYFLQSKDLPVLTPIPTRNNSYGFYHNDSYYALYPYMNGTSLSASEYLQQPAKIQTVAYMLANLHDILLDLPFSEQFPERNIVRTLFTNVVPFLKTQGTSPDIVRILLEVEEEMRTLFLQIPLQVVQLNPHPTNILFRDNRLVAMLDFEKAEQSTRLFDLCYFSTSLLDEVFSDPSKLEDWLKSIKSFFTAYHRKRKISRDERKAIWYIMLAINATFIAFYSHDENLREKNRAKFLWIYEQRTEIDRFLYLRG
ncbi:phosphotransferase enzyme family protein [Shouchella patagoniensis]|uniref:phosphotransferase enzyme family protein n=1 Tax=Shouchella patagoniensis TaxID=228576 RepID=UPI0009955D24|nr:phosphotransferase [Shouchella patagoniensis]